MGWCWFRNIAHSGQKDLGQNLQPLFNLEYRSKHRKAKTPNTKSPKTKTPKTKTPKDQNTEAPKHRKYTFIRC